MQAKYPSALTQADTLTDIWLTGTDAMDSVLMTGQGTSTQNYAYSTYGEQTKPSPNASPMGFNGQRYDPLNGHYHLGNGYRSYSPSLMQFLAPDNLSPFGAGGINPYAYCENDPINRIDPNGHLSQIAMDMTGLALTAVGIVFSGFTLGASIAPIVAGDATLFSLSGLGLAVGALAETSNFTGAASTILEYASHHTYPKTTNILGIISLGTGILTLLAVTGWEVTILKTSYRAYRGWRGIIQNLRTIKNAENPSIFDKFRPKLRIYLRPPIKVIFYTTAYGGDLLGIANYVAPSLSHNQRVINTLSNVFQIFGLILAADAKLDGSIFDVRRDAKNTFFYKKRNGTYNTGEPFLQETDLDNNQSQSAEDSGYSSQGSDDEYLSNTEPGATENFYHPSPSNGNLSGLIHWQGMKCLL